MPKNKVSDLITDQEIAFAHLPRLAVGRAVEELRRLNLGREQVLARLWEIANLSPEMTRGSITGQVKALSMIVAIESLIPDRRAGSSRKQSAPPPAHPEFYASACPPRPAVGRRPQQDTTIDPQPTPAQQEDQAEDSPAAPEPKHAPASVAEAPPNPRPSQSTFANRFTPSEAPEPYVPLFASVPDLRVPFSIKKDPFNPFVRPR
jgi:hypothetical protein